MTPLIETLTWQFRMTWSLGRDFWLPALTDDLLLWRQAPSAASMRFGTDGTWQPDWDEDPDPVPPATAGWLTWHIQWWWTSAIASFRGEPIPERESIRWPVTADAVRTTLSELADTWHSMLEVLDDSLLERPAAFPWPDPRPVRHLVAWVNSELMKNLAELGDCVRLHLARPHDERTPEV